MMSLFFCPGGGGVKISDKGEQTNKPVLLKKNYGGGHVFF